MESLDRGGPVATGHIGVEVEDRTIYHQRSCLPLEGIGEGRKLNMVHCCFLVPHHTGTLLPVCSAVEYGTGGEKEKS